MFEKVTFKFHFEARDLKNYGAFSNKKREGFEGSMFMHSGYFIFPHSFPHLQNCEEERGLCGDNEGKV